MRLRSLQQVEDLCLKLRFIIRPVAVNLPRVAGEFTIGSSAPRSNRVVCAAESGITADVCDHGHFTRRCLSADYFAFTIEGTNDLHTEVNLHRGSTYGRMLIEEAIMPVCTQPGMTSEKFPDKIESRLPRVANLSNQHAPAHRRERLRADSLSNNLIVHDETIPF